MQPRALTDLCVSLPQRAFSVHEHRGIAHRHQVRLLLAGPLGRAVSLLLLIAQRSTDGLGSCGKTLLNFILLDSLDRRIADLLLMPSLRSNPLARDASLPSRRRCGPVGLIDDLAGMASLEAGPLGLRLRRSVSHGVPTSHTAVHLCRRIGAFLDDLA